MKRAEDVQRIIANMEFNMGRMSPRDLYEREIFELQKTLQQALIRQKELIEQEYVLKRKISLLGGDENQFEMEL